MSEGEGEASTQPVSIGYPVLRVRLNPKLLGADGRARQHLRLGGTRRRPDLRSIRRSAVLPVQLWRRRPSPAVRPTAPSQPSLPAPRRLSTRSVSPLALSSLQAEERGSNFFIAV